MDKLIITVAVNGGVLRRETTPHVPLTPEEIADSACAAHEAGAAIAHVHVRDEHGKACQDIDRYREVMERIAGRCDMIVNLSTGPVGDLEADECLQPLQLVPDMASFAGGSVNLGEHPLVAPPAFLRKLAAGMLEVGTRPELAIFHDGMVDTCIQLAQAGLLDEPLYFLFALGTDGGAPANAHTLLHFLQAIPPGSNWSVGGEGFGGLDMAMLAIPLGGHVRVGLEDQINYRPGELATSNAQLVARVARLATEYGRELATPAEARHILGVKQGATQQAALGSR